MHISNYLIQYKILSVETSQKENEWSILVYSVLSSVQIFNLTCTCQLIQRFFNLMWRKFATQYWVLTTHNSSGATNLFGIQSLSPEGKEFCSSCGLYVVAFAVAAAVAELCSPISPRMLIWGVVFGVVCPDNCCCCCWPRRGMLSNSIHNWRVSILNCRSCQTFTHIYTQVALGFSFVVSMAYYYIYSLFSFWSMCLPGSFTIHYPVSTYIYLQSYWLPMFDNNLTIAAFQWIRYVVYKIESWLASMRTSNVFLQ